MQNRNFIKIFTILFAIVSLYQLSFTWVAGGVEDDALAYASQYPAEQQEAKEKFYLDSVNSEPVYDILLTEYTYADCKSRELNLGLDLKGGMNVTLEVMVIDVVKALSSNSRDTIFTAAIANALSAQKK
jgi:SecD/SecF fusion protein